jgi:hypothetical protein
MIIPVTIHIARNAIVAHTRLSIVVKQITQLSISTTKNAITIEMFNTSEFIVFVLLVAFIILSFIIV